MNSGICKCGTRFEVGPGKNLCDNCTKRKAAEDEQKSGHGRAKAAVQSNGGEPPEDGTAQCNMAVSGDRVYDLVPRVANGCKHILTKRVIEMFNASDFSYCGVCGMKLRKTEKEREVERKKPGRKRGQAKTVKFTDVPTES